MHSRQDGRVHLPPQPKGINEPHWRLPTTPQSPALHTPAARASTQRQLWMPSIDVPHHSYCHTHLYTHVLYACLPSQTHVHTHCCPW